MSLNRSENRAIQCGVLFIGLGICLFLITGLAIMKPALNAKVYKKTKCKVVEGSLEEKFCPCMTSQTQGPHCPKGQFKYACLKLLVSYRSVKMTVFENFS